jgi:hypothetical protein
VSRFFVVLGAVFLACFIAGVVSAKDTAPSSPLNLTAIAGDGHVNLSWSPPTDADQYEIGSFWIYWYADPSFGGIHWEPSTNTTLWEGTQVTPETTEYRHTGLTNGVWYWYHIRAHTSDAIGNPSDVVVAIPKRLPSAPWGLRGEVLDDQVFLEWEPPDITGDAIITAYKILRGSTQGNLELIKTLSYEWWDWGLYSLPPTNYTDSDLQGREVWYYQVIAVNTLGEGPPSDILLVGESELAPVVPSIPEHLRAWVDDDYVHVSWRAPGYDGGLPVFKYWIFRWTEDNEPQAIAEVPANVFDFLDVYVDENVEYHYAVTAMNAVGESPMSLEATVTVHPTTLEDPSDNNLIDTGDDQTGQTLLIPLVLIVLASAGSLILILIGRRLSRPPD